MQLGGYKGNRQLSIDKLIFLFLSLVMVDLKIFFIMQITVMVMGDKKTFLTISNAS